MPKAIAELEKAIAVSDKYPVHSFELDQIYEKAGESPKKTSRGVGEKAFRDSWPR